MTIGDRLKLERERLGYSQSDFSARAQTTKKSQIDYEKNVTSPRANYLEAIATLGADIQFIVTGTRASMHDSEVMQSLLTKIALLDELEKVIVLNLASGLLEIRQK
jgi:transcriptional regulator with XRE-family HTH domain